MLIVQKLNVICSFLPSKNAESKETWEQLLLKQKQCCRVHRIPADNKKKKHGNYFIL